MGNSNSRCSSSDSSFSNIDSISSFGRSSDVPGKEYCANIQQNNNQIVIYKTRFHTDGELYIVTRSNILTYPCDVVGNSVGTKDTPTENVLAIGVLAQQIAKKGGQSLVDQLASSQHKCWSWGEIRFTRSHGLDQGDSSPKHICHFCVPPSYAGDVTYLQIMSLFERAMNITHDMGRSSLAFPLVGAGINNYPAMDVIKAIVDAASLFRHKGSPLKKVVIVVWENDSKNQQIVESTCGSTLRSYQPVGSGFTKIVPVASDYSDPEKAFRASIGTDRNVTDERVLPIEKGARVRKYQREVEKVKALRPELNGKVESYGWHGTTGDAANSIKKNGFDMSMVTTHWYGKGAYFATTADDSHVYAVPAIKHVPEGLKDTIKDPNGTFTMLLCKIVTGKSKLGREPMTKPDNGYDSAKNGDGSYMVIFNVDAILPIAIIEYTIQRKK